MIRFFFLMQSMGKSEESEKVSEMTGDELKRYIEEQGEFVIVPPDALCRKFVVPVEGEKIVLPGGVNVVNDCGWTPLMACCHSPATEVAALLIIQEIVATNGDLDRKTIRGPGEAASDWSALHIATAYGMPTIIKMLIAEGAEVNTKNSELWTPLMEATRRNFPSIVKMLIEAGADPNEKIPQKAQGTPHSCLSMAARHGFVDVARKLLDGGAEKDMKNDIGWTALHEACHMNELAVVQLLILHGASVCAKTETGRMPHDLAFSDDVLKCLTDAMTEDQRVEFEIHKKNAAGGALGGAERKDSRGDGDDDEDDLDETESGEILLDEDSEFHEGKTCTERGKPSKGFPAPRRCNSEQLARRRRSLTRMEMGDATNEDGDQDLKSPVDAQPRFRLLGHLPDLAASSQARNDHAGDNKKRSPKSKTKRGKRLSAPRKRAKNVPEHVPDAYICAVSGRFMREPVQSPYGHIFDRRYIRAWIKKHGRKCPFTGMPLSRSDLIPDKNLRRSITEYREKMKCASEEAREPNVQGVHESAENSKLREEAEDDLYNFS